MAKDKKKRPEDDGPEVPEWIVTFSDMISLLVTFFVLLMTFSSLEEDDVIRVKGAMVGTRGLIEDTVGTDMVKPPADLVSKADPIRGLRDRHSRPPEELPDDVAKFGEKQQDDQVEVDLARLGDGLAFGFGPDCHFKPGSAEVPPALAERAAELAGILAYYPYMVLVEGFTDGAFKPSSRYPDAESLALARAAAVADIMTGTSDLQPMKVLVAGPGSERPVASDETPIGRQQNRRVEVRVLTLESSRATYLTAERQRLEAERLEDASRVEAPYAGDGPSPREPR
jgi:chemotaxis protein MotB